MCDRIIRSCGEELEPLEHEQVLGYSLTIGRCFDDCARSGQTYRTPAIPNLEVSGQNAEARLQAKTLLAIA
jgi:hypothetical protein